MPGLLGVGFGAIYAAWGSKD
eukprot:COSAG01_NODE_69378_length_261_cov_1.209877_1_plen_20_part_01